MAKENEKELVTAPILAPAPTYTEHDTTSVLDTDAGRAAYDEIGSVSYRVENYNPFTFSQADWQNRVNESIQNYGPFSYDFNADALYQQYKDRYIQQGKLAMQDVMGQAAAMTGGYGSSYAASVGNQAYQQSLQQLNDVIPELYQLAYDRYNTGKQDLYAQADYLNQLHAREYGEHQDGYNQLLDLLGIKTDAFDRISGLHYTDQGNKNTASDKAFDAAISIWGENNSNAWREAEFNEDQRRYEEGKDTSSESEDTIPNKGKSPSGNSYDNGGYSESDVKKAQEFVGADADGMWGPNSSAAAKAKGYDSIADVIAAMKDGGGGNAFTGSTYTDAYNFAVKNGVPSAHAAGIMTQGEWTRRRASYKTYGTGDAEVKNYSSYKEYLAAITEYLVEQYK